MSAPTIKHTGKYKCDCEEQKNRINYYLLKGFDLESAQSFAEFEHGMDIDIAEGGAHKEAQ